MEPTVKARGRIEQRTIEVLPAEALSKEIGKEWKGLNQIARVTRVREVKKKGVWKIETEVAYLITSLSPETALPQEILAFNRNHWAIENNLHRNKDTLLREDEYTNRSDDAPRNVNTLLNLTLKIFYAMDKSPKLALEKCQDDKNIAIAWI
jgi:predicted transposase YbfD/YdcC